MDNRVDEKFYEVVYDKDGKPQPRLKERILPEPDNSFQVYDNSHGHCALCGRLSCNGLCFR
jgi:hypothetical protein